MPGMVSACQHKLSLDSLYPLTTSERDQKYKCWLSKREQVSTCPDELSAQDISLEALARDVRNVSLKSDISSFTVMVWAEITGHQSGTF